MILLALVLGFLLGVLVNLLADSLPTLRRLSGAHCRSCGAPRPLPAWSGLIALLLGTWECAYCSEGRSYRGPLVEAVLAAGAGVIYMRADTSFEFLSAILVFTLFLLIVVIDLEHRLILHAVTAPAGVMLILLALLDPERRMTSTLVGGAVGLGFFLLLYLGGGLFAKLMGRLRGEELEEVAFGFGDVTLAGLIGLTVGWPAVLPALLVGILAAGCFSLLFILATAAMGKYTPLTPIPYGPFLVLGALSVYFGALAPFPGVMQL